MNALAWNGDVSTDTSRDDQHRHKDLTRIDAPEALYTDWAKHAACGDVIGSTPYSMKWSLLNEMEFSSDRIAEAIEEMKYDGQHQLHHYEK